MPSTFELDIGGMTCAICAQRIEKKLKKQEGIHKVQVNLATEKAKVHLDSRVLKLEDCIAIIESMGYQAQLNTPTTPSEHLTQANADQLLRRLILSCLCSAPLLWTMWSHLGSLGASWVPPQLHSPIWQCALATPVQFLIALPFYKAAAMALRSGSLDMNVLVVMGTSAAYFYSLALSILHQWQPTTHLYFETSAVLITLVLLGKWLEARCKGKAGHAIQHLLQQQASMARRIVGDTELMVQIEQLEVGDIILVKAGEKIPADGKIVEGQAHIDASMLSGEASPEFRTVGDRVIGSSICQTGYLNIQVDRSQQDSMLAQIIQVVQSAQGSKAPLQRIADRISQYFVPAMIIIALATFVVWSVLKNAPLGQALEMSIAVLVIACPCALGLATPMSIMVGAGRAAQFGILFKSAEHLENAKRITDVVFDKTGTLTHGQLEVIHQQAFIELKHDPLLIAASLEKHSEHPISQALVNKAKLLEDPSSKPAFFKPQDYQSFVGLGIQAHIEGQLWSIGNEAFMKKLKVPLNDEILRAQQPWLEQGKTTILMAREQTLCAMFILSDNCKPTAPTAIAELKRCGIKVHMLTGDHQRTAQHISQSLGGLELRAQCLPTDKSTYITQLQSTGAFVAMVGDGINDAPALASADLGFSMASGTDVAIETGDITLMNSDPMSVVKAIHLSQKTVLNIQQNLFWALAYNSLAVPLAAMGHLSPMLAGLAMAFSSVSVVLNALRLQNVRV